MTRLKANKEKERDRCKIIIDCLSSVLQSAAIPHFSPKPVMCCHCEERSDKATREVTKTRFNVIQFEVHVISMSEDFVVIINLWKTKVDINVNFGVRASMLPEQFNTMKKQMKSIINK
jgi:hypothetical protein